MSFANCPIELFKVRLQIQDPSRPRLYNNIFDCARKSIASRGITGVYRGITATLLRDVPSFAGYFGTYEAMKMWLRPESGPLTSLNLLVAGGVAGFGKIFFHPPPSLLLAGAWLPCYPQDVIKSRMQTSTNYKTTLDCTISIFQEQGIKGFFRGFGPTMARAFPANAATFLAYEFVHSRLS